MLNVFEMLCLKLSFSTATPPFTSQEKYPCRACYVLMICHNFHSILVQMQASQVCFTYKTTLVLTHISISHHMHPKVFEFKTALKSS